MGRPISKIAPEWWDYTTLDNEILTDAAGLTMEKIAGLGRDGFRVRFYDTLEEFYLAEALEYIIAWRQATADNPAIYPNLNLSPSERLDVVTFVQNAGNLPGFANSTTRGPLDQPAPRSWTAEALWLALSKYFGVDASEKGGYVP